LDRTAGKKIEDVFFIVRPKLCRSNVVVMQLPIQNKKPAGFLSILHKGIKATVVE